MAFFPIGNLFSYWQPPHLMMASFPIGSLFSYWQLPLLVAASCATSCYWLTAMNIFLSRAWHFLLFLSWHYIHVIASTCTTTGGICVEPCPCSIKLFHEITKVSASKEACTLYIGQGVLVVKKDLDMDERLCWDTGHIPWWYWSTLSRLPATKNRL